MPRCELRARAPRAAACLFAAVATTGLSGAPAEAMRWGACESAVVKDDAASRERLYTYCFDGETEARSEQTRLVFNNRGVARIELGDIEGAITDFEIAVAEVERPMVGQGKLPENGVAYLNLARLLWAFGDFEQASSDLEKAMGLDLPYEAAAYLMRGRLRAADGREAEALADFDAALVEDPGFTAAQTAKALLLATAEAPGLRDPEQAVAMARAGVAGEDGSAARAVLAVAYAAADRFPEAAREIEAAMALWTVSGREPAAILNRLAEDIAAGEVAGNMFADPQLPPIFSLKCGNGSVKFSNRFPSTSRFSAGWNYFWPTSYCY